MNFYNHIVINNPLIKEFFPEFDGGDVFQITIITDLHEHDVPLLVQAQDLNECFIEALEDYTSVEHDVEHNVRYFPKSPEDKKEIEDTGSMLVGDSLFFRSGPEYNEIDFIVSQNYVYLDSEIVASVITMSINEPPPLNNKITVQ